MKKFIVYFFGLVILILSIILTSNMIINNIEEEVSKINEAKSKDLLLKSFKAQTQNADYNYLNVQRPDFVEIAKKSINTVVHVKSSSSVVITVSKILFLEDHKEDLKWVPVLVL